jgi:hypothetical protein
LYKGLFFFFLVGNKWKSRHIFLAGKERHLSPYLDYEFLLGR